MTEHTSERGFTRRSLLHRVAVGACVAGTSGWEIAARASTLPSRKKPIRSCVFVFYYGGPSHLDTFDMKPDAPKEVRGEFQPIATSVPGLQICEHLPHLTKIMHKVAIVRSLHHTNRLHDSAGTELYTGRQGPKGDREEFASIPQFFPCHGAVLHYLSRHVRRDVHHAVLPWLFHNVVDVPCQGGGFLGSRFDPFLVAGDPKSASFRADSLKRPDALPFSRIERRRSLLSRLDAGGPATSAPAREFSDLYNRAYELLGSQSLREAMRIDRETAATRKRYGIGSHGERGGGNGAQTAYGRNLRGQSLLMARRLVEAGIPFVNVNDYRQQGQNWDSHADNFNQHKKHMLPPADRSLAALINDLDERGLLDSTLVVAAGEFGRTPRINGNAGRDHWPDCYSILLAGGGIRGGTVYGASDRQGAYPDRDPVTPADLAATIYDRFGFSAHSEVRDKTGRPWRIAEGRPIAGIFA